MEATDPEIGRLYKVSGDDAGSSSAGVTVTDEAEGSACPECVPFSFGEFEPFECNSDFNGDYTVPAECNGTYALQIQIAQSSGECKYLVDLTPEFQCEGGEAERRATTDASDCQSGSGRFALMVSHYYDWNKDGSNTATLVPLQVSGTGVLTNHAWIDSISMVDDDGYPVRVMLANHLVALDGVDHLTNASGVSIALDNPVTLSSGQVSGYPAFVVEQWSRQDGFSMLVDMSWTCSTDDVVTVNRTKGYSIKASQAGCGIPQGLTMRIGPRELVWEPYGNPNVVIRTPTTDTVNGRKFTYTRGPIVVSGLLKMVTPSAAKVQLLEAKVGGVSVCTPGLYTLNAE